MDMIGEREPYPDQQVEGTRVWTLWFQFPVISFLDIRRKTTLIYLIADLLRERGIQIEPDEFCMGRFVQQDVADYSEGCVGGGACVRVSVFVCVHRVYPCMSLYVVQHAHTVHN